VRQPVFLVFLATVVGYSGSLRSASSESRRDSAFPKATLQPGFYIAPWNDDYQTRWLLLLELARRPRPGCALTRVTATESRLGGLGSAFHFPPREG